MNYKFLGNSIDLFKHDLLTRVVREDDSNLFYVPMVTEPKQRSYDPKLLVYELGRKNDPLYKYMKGLFDTDELLDPGCVKEYYDREKIKNFIYTRERASRAYFEDKERNICFHQAVARYTRFEEKTLIYLDPDVGLDINLKRRFRSNREMYLKPDDVLKFLYKLKKGDSIAFFQHLGNSQYTLDARLEDLKKAFGEWVFICGYQRIQGSMVFIFRNEIDYQKMHQKVNQYFLDYQDLKHSDKLFIK